MNTYQFIKDYKSNVQYRNSFFHLAKEIFGLDFAEWYNRGCWDDNFVCYSYIHDEKVIANASINKMEIVIEDAMYKAIQIGTVMTHPEYRNQGLSAKLMNIIIKEFESEYEFIYLFANDTVLDFYPKFGFERLKEYHFSINTSELNFICERLTLRKLNSTDLKDFKIMERFAEKRIPVSKQVGIRNNKHLLMFYFLLAFPENIYYIEEQDVLVIYEQEDETLHLFDIISEGEFDFDSVCMSLASDQVQTIDLYFTPDIEHHVNTAPISGEDTLFVRSTKDFPKHFRFPLTSHS